MYKKSYIQCTKNPIYNVQKTRYTMYKKTDTQCTSIIRNITITILLLLFLTVQTFLD